MKSLGLPIAAFLAFAVMTGSAHAADFPRTPEGKPDLSGVWQSFGGADADLSPHAASKDGPASLGFVVGGDIPYLPSALAKKTQNFNRRATEDPRAKCYMPGVPRVTYTPLPFQILQAPDQVTVLYEYVHTVRNIYTDGTKHPEGHIDWWLGDSRGHWDGDTLVVDVIHFNDLTWFDHVGDYHSDELHVVERYTPTGPDHIQYQATIEDPKVFSRPWTIELTLYRRKEKNIQLLEYDCYTFDYEQHYP